ncbi:MAG: carboxypeptidase M32 [Chloroflexota bacterium]|nr:MAG: carboxypeptidase M32 [Chloroflexota bacterium]
MEHKLKQLKNILAEVADIQGAANLLEWDQQTNMPPKGAEARGHQLGALSRLAHIKFVAPEVGKLIEDLLPYAEGLDPDSDDARLLEVTNRKYKKSVKVPSDFVAEFARVTTMAHGAWEEAREENDFSKFQPHLEKIVDLDRQYAEFFAPYDHVYDPLLDTFEPGMSTTAVKKIFEELRPQQVKLIQAIGEQEQVADDFLYQEFEHQAQLDFGNEVITKYGFEWDRGRQDEAAHPFTTSFGIDDVRLTTRVQLNHLNSAIFGTFHEGGHAIYEQGIAHSLARTPLADGASLAVHESQSRMYENLVGRSYDFWVYFYPRLQEFFPNQFAKVNLETFYKGINKVEPSLIRVEADEATYNLHIMLRLELEIELMEGKLEVSDLPFAWNARMEEYLGITPTTDTEGVLQDVHWSSGLLGYFSTYALGNLISAQLWEKINEDIPDLSGQIQSGEFAGLLGWLRKNIHCHGAKFKPQELVKRATGSEIDSAPYMRYLTKKYGEIYTL